MELVPRTIHYCWFGRAPLPPLAEACLRSWKEHCPDFTITEWNEDTFDIHAAPEYVRQAYAERKWAFVSDYVRLFALFTHGGIYMDTDVEVIRPLDAFLKHKAFTGFENPQFIPTAIMGSEPGNGWIGLLMRHYDHRTFVRQDGSLDLTTNVTVITELTQRHYGIVLNNTYQELADGVAIYPSDYFCPKVYVTKDIHVTENTHTIHHFGGSWLDEKMRARQLAQRRLHCSLEAAFKAYNDKSWRTAYRQALASMRLSPRLMWNRGMWSLILKSLWREKVRGRGAGAGVAD